MKALSKSPFDSLTRPGPVAAPAKISGYWISQMLAVYFVGGAIIGLSSKIAGALFFGLFAVLFVLHLFKPWSKTAAILGLLSFCAFTAMIAGMSSPWFVVHAPSVELMVLVSAGLALWGVAVDALHPTHL
ncbi:MAG TPA: hypothetical protein VMF08_16075 [Candidatus Sulfotelmatobacter sp.]|nr:hypothetical protein [Candidatus Sulfotelmatobacter sp.]